MTIIRGGSMSTGVENTKRVVPGPARHLAENLGPQCRRCRQTEARCAYLGSCCPFCSHFRHLNSDGNERPNAGRTRSAQCGTESGYSSHRYFREPACGPCKAAHSAYVQSREAS